MDNNEFGSHRRAEKSPVNETPKTALKRRSPIWWVVGILAIIALTFFLLTGTDTIYDQNEEITGGDVSAEDQPETQERSDTTYSTSGAADRPIETSTEQESEEY